MEDYLYGFYYYYYYYYYYSLLLLLLLLLLSLYVFTKPTVLWNLYNCCTEGMCRAVSKRKLDVKYSNVQ